MSGCENLACNKLTSGILKHPVLAVVIIAVAIRLVLSPFLTYDFDIYHWGVIIENFQSGNGLYEIAGYYYTPVWGYFLGFVSMIQDMLMTMDVFGVRFTNMFPIEMLVCVFHTATSTTIGFNISMKVPLIICDVLVAMILYWLIMERTGDKKKGVAAIALWLLCPIVIYMSAIQNQFDTISALLTLLTIVLVYKDRCFLGGMLFSLAVLLKFFPAVCIIVLIGYVYAKHREDGRWKMKITEAVLGAGMMSAVLLMPQILDGTVMDTLSFITGRVGEAGNIISAMSGYASMVAMALGMLYFGYRMIKTRENIDDAFFKNMMFALSCAVVFSFTPQYIIVALPLIITYLVCYDGRMRLCWILISFGSLIAAISINNFSLLVSASEFMGLVSPEWIIHMMQAMESFSFANFTLVAYINAIGNIIEFLGILLIFVIYFENRIGNRISKLGLFVSNIKRWDYGREI